LARTPPACARRCENKWRKTFGRWGALQAEPDYYSERNRRKAFRSIYERPMSPQRHRPSERRPLVGANLVRVAGRPDIRRQCCHCLRHWAPATNPRAIYSWLLVGPPLLSQKPTIPRVVAAATAPSVLCYSSRVVAAATEPSVVCYSSRGPSNSQPHFLMIQFMWDLVGANRRAFGSWNVNVALSSV
jgi:hypothetical protein